MNPWSEFPVKLDKFGKVAVIGAGDMGHGIAETCALAGYDVILKDVNEEVLEKAMIRIMNSLSILDRKKRLGDETIDNVMDRMHPTMYYDDMSNDIGLAIEAVPEIMKLKKQVFEELEAVLPEQAIIASNTSNMSISELAKVTRNPSRIVGMHFFNPPVIMKTVEIIKGNQARESVMEKMIGFTFSIDHLPITVLKDSPGFIVNRVQAPSQLLLIKMVEKGIATFHEIDAMARNMQQPMGPFETFDYVGLDVVKHGLDYFARTIDPRYNSPPWLNELVDSGNLGKKTGKGIHDWSAGRPVIDPDRATGKVSMLDLLVVQVNEACKILEQGIVKYPGEIDVAIKNGTGNKIGIFSILKSNRQGVVDRLKHLASLLDEPLFKPHPALLTMEVPSGRKAMRRLKHLRKEILGDKS
ncbi:3-hydroxyacyl-CoA dehydrogenase family protein [Candidatus Bathyarchaeota archaeon]|nr:3-hydroxyacyl-CoA dehydrogenase family protein [Candidatus Bathyarchaeota archaeon]